MRRADGQPIALENGWYPRDLLPGLDRQDLGGSLYEIFRTTLRARHRQRRADAVGRGRRRGDRPPARRPAQHPPPGLPPRLRGRRPAAGVRRLPLPRRPLPAPHVAPGTRHRNRHHRRDEAVTTSDTSVDQQGPRFNLAPIQKFGRSLMLPIAALPAAALLLRLGAARPAGGRRPRLGPGRRRRRCRRQRAVRQPAAAVRGRCRDRHGEEGRRLDGAGRGRRLPGVQGRRRRHVAVRAGRPAARAAPRS